MKIDGSRAVKIIDGHSILFILIKYESSLELTKISPLQYFVSAAASALDSNAFFFFFFLFFLADRNWKFIVEIEQSLRVQQVLCIIHINFHVN